MWYWIAAGWIAVALVGAALHHRLRARSSSLPPEVLRFLMRLERELTQSHPDVQFLGMLPDRFACLLSVDGQETPVGLRGAFERAEAFPEAFAATVAELVQDVREVGLDRAEELEFGAAAQLLMPQVRSRQWLEEQGTFGDSGLVHTALNQDLVVVYVVDDVSTLLFVCRAHLKRWGRTVADVHRLALANLAASGATGLEGASSEAVLLQSGDGFDAARLLLLEQQDDLLVSVPDRDVLWAGPAEGQDLAQLMRTTERLAESAPHPVSSKVYRVSGGRLEPVRENG